MSPTRAGATPLLAVELRYEEDVVLARQRTRQLAALLGFDGQEQTRLATAVSEIARNAFRYARGGRVEFGVDLATPQRFVVRVTDEGPGIARLADVLDGRYVSTTGMGLGIVGARRLVDDFDLRSAPGQGTVVVLGQRLSRRAASLAAPQVAAIAEELARLAPQSALEEVQAQNREQLRTLEELRARQAEIERLNHELEETNRGVLALYAELEDTALALRKASEHKSAFLSNVSHELRTPLSSILNLSRLLLDESEGATGEQRRQVQLIRKSAQSLFDIVNDLLDLAKIEAGRIDVRAAPIDVAELLGTLRGVFRPLAPPAVSLVVAPAPPGLTLHTDEGKLAQILRNFLSNAVKYTERGEIRLQLDPEPAEGPGLVRFDVTDTGVGIPPQHLERIFEEFTQVEGPHQARVRGTGLGLPLSRRLAGLLGGTISVRSVTAQGSTFTLVVPRVLPQRLESTPVVESHHG